MDSKDPAIQSEEGLDQKYPKIPEFDEDLNFGNVDEAINTYVATRDDLDRERKAYNKYEANAKNYLDRIEMWIKDQADRMGVESFRTKSGTAYKNTKTSYRMGNWEDFIEWIKKTGNFQCLERRVAKLATKEIHDETGEIPPGVHFESEVCFDVRRPSK